MNSFQRQLAAWSFRPISESGRVLTDGDGVPQEQQQPAEHEPNKELREIAKQLHDAGVRI
jgi:hypothetical protein